MPTFDRPVAFKRPDLFDRSYPFEDEDAFVPQGTWLSDFVESMRGIETPSLFCLWSALWAASAATVREVALDWLEGEPLFPNLYVFLVAPAGRCHKTTALKHAFKTLNALHRALPGPDDKSRTLDDAFLHELTRFGWVTSKTTPEGFEKILIDTGDIPLPYAGGVGSIRRGAQMTICAGQLDTFLNRSTYTVGMTEKLTELYDCDDFKNYLTKSGGNVELRDIFVTMIGAITPDEMKKCLPDESHGDGFVSRVCIAVKHNTLRCYARPVQLDGFPRITDLADRLAFLLRHKRSKRYTLDAEALDWYERWYSTWKKLVDADETYLERTGEARYDVILLRLATLIRFCRYDDDTTVVTRRDLDEARAILDGTFRPAQTTKRSLGASSGFGENYQTILGYVTRNARNGMIERKKIISYMSSRSISSRDVDVVLRQLEEEGVLVCTTNETSAKKSALSYRVAANASLIAPS